MKCIISGKEYTYHANIRNHESIRASFNDLAQQTFGLHFENWYRQGYWGASYIPHVLLDGDRVVANVSVNIMNTMWKNRAKRYIQLGTVMTDAEYRNKGLARFLMHKALEEWQDQCDAVYLFANDRVLEFYPKFGFVAASEYQCEMPVAATQGIVRKLDMSSKRDQEMLLSKYAQSNPFSALPMIDNAGLLMFYCAQFMSEHVYYVEKFDAIVIAKYQNDSMLCYDIFCGQGSDLGNILAIMATESTKKIRFGFSLKQGGPCKIALLKEEDTTLFVLSSKENIFAHKQFMFPLLSHA